MVSSQDQTPATRLQSVELDVHVSSCGMIINDSDCIRAKLAGARLSKAHRSLGTLPSVLAALVEIPDAQCLYRDRQTEGCR